MEEWKDIPGFEGLYQASTEGRVKSLERVVKFGTNNQTTRIQKGKILSPKIDKKGRAIVCLFKNKKRHHLQIITIISRTFIPNPENKPKAIHIDGNKLNNNINNIKWVTCSEIVKMNAAKIDKNIIFEGKHFRSQAELARHYNLKPELVATRKYQGWTLEETIKIKPGVLGCGRVYLYEYYGKKYSLKQLSEMNGINIACIKKRLQNGWSFYEAVEIPVSKGKKRKEGKII